MKNLLTRPGSCKFFGHVWQRSGWRTQKCVFCGAKTRRRKHGVKAK